MKFPMPMHQRTLHALRKKDKNESKMVYVVPALVPLSLLSHKLRLRSISAEVITSTLMMMSNPYAMGILHVAGVSLDPLC